MVDLFDDEGKPLILNSGLETVCVPCELQPSFTPCSYHKRLCSERLSRGLMQVMSTDTRRSYTSNKEAAASYIKRRYGTKSQG